MASNNGGTGAFRAFIALVIFGSSVALLIALLMCLQAQDLSDISGSKEGVPEESATKRDFRTVLSKAIEGKYPVAISEGEINRMIAKRLQAEQKGPLSDFASFEEILVRLKPDLAEVIIVRKIWNHRITTSLFMQFDIQESENGVRAELVLHGGGLVSEDFGPKSGGRFGSLEIPQGFLIMTIPEYVKIAAALSAEIDLGFKSMTRFEIGEDKIILDPTFPENETKVSSQDR